MFNRIIVGLDGSKQSKTAARIGFDLAARYDGEVTLVHVPHAETAAFVVGAVAGYHAAIVQPTLKEIEAAGHKVLEEGVALAKEMEFDAVKTHMSHGEAAAEITAYAQDINADLIITGRRGLGAIPNLVLGSITQRINHAAKCACLSLP